MSATTVNTHGYLMQSGRHKGELITRVPVGYLKWMVCERHQEARYAEAELARRGTVTPSLDVSGHAIDRVSLRFIAHWMETRLNDEEGLHAWLCRMAANALQQPEAREGCHDYAHMRFVFDKGGVWPILKTVVRGERP